MWFVIWFTELRPLHRNMYTKGTAFGAILPQEKGRSLQNPKKTYYPIHRNTLILCLKTAMTNNEEQHHCTLSRYIEWIASWIQDGEPPAVAGILPLPTHCPCAERALWLGTAMQCLQRAMHFCNKVGMKAVSCAWIGCEIFLLTSSEMCTRLRCEKTRKNTLFLTKNTS